MQKLMCKGFSKRQVRPVSPFRKIKSIQGDIIEAIREFVQQQRAAIEEGHTIEHTIIIQVFQTTPRQ